MPAGRPSLYTSELAERICDELASGMSLVQVCNQDGMPGMRTVMAWAKENEDFSSRYAHAREVQAEVMDDKILTAADEATSENAAAVRVKVDAYKWRAAKLAPKRYGDKLDVTSGDKPITPPAEDIAGSVAALLGKAAKRAKV